MKIDILAPLRKAVELAETMVNLSESMQLQEQASIAIGLLDPLTDVVSDRINKGINVLNNHDDYDFQMLVKRKEEVIEKYVKS